MELVIKIIQTALNVAFTLFLVNNVKDYIFLETHTKKQKKISNCLFISGAFLWAISTFNFDGTEIYELEYKLENLKNVVLCMAFVLLFVAFVYSSVTGRKKAKWLGIFSCIPVIGIYDALSEVIELPAEMLKEKIQYPDLITAAIEGLVLAVGIVLSVKKPAFYIKYKESRDDRSLNVREELGIWAVGTWLFVYDIIFTYETVSRGLKVYLSVTNLVVSAVILILIYESNYREYYYKQNLHLQKSLITTMADLVENRDQNTGGHIQRTAKYVEIIAKKLAEEHQFEDILTPGYMEDMIVAAPLHDVGKIHIPDAILNKPGKLDNDEFMVMKSHAAAGAEIIDRTIESTGDISYLKIAKEMAEYHHERVDGKGYPHGIGGEVIPLCAKILAVADVFDALVSKRCYKDAMPLDKAFSIIEEEAGNHFDQIVAKAFLDSRDEIVEYLQAN